MGGVAVAFVGRPELSLADAVRLREQLSLLLDSQCWCCGRELPVNGRGTRVHKIGLRISCYQRWKRVKFAGDAPPPPEPRSAHAMVANEARSRLARDRAAEFFELQESPFCLSWSDAVARMGVHQRTAERWRKWRDNGVI